MLGWIVGGLIVITIIGTITIKKIKDEMCKKGMERVLVDMIDNNRNTIRLKDLDSGKKYEMHGKGISGDIYEGQKIVIKTVNAITV
ncbi:MAG: hypothetical protein NC320_13325 [Clostridium sp.]|nr:hypothetical protein [Clostridium sp.]